MTNTTNEGVEDDVSFWQSGPFCRDWNGRMGHEKDIMDFEKKLKETVSSEITDEGVTKIIFHPDQSSRTSRKNTKNNKLC